MKSEKILVVGASGTVGSALVKLLREDGYRVKETTSKVVAGDNKVQVDLATGLGVREAFADVDRAFLLSPPGFADQYAILAPLIQEAKRRGLKKVVLMTAMGANAVETSPFRRAEKDLEQSGLSYNIIRPNWFLQNFNTFWVDGIRSAGKITLPAGKAKVSFIDAQDIAAVAAKLLTDDSFRNRDFDLTGPTAVDHDDVARAISSATGKNVTYEEIAPGDLKRGLLQVGLPEDYVDFLLMIFGFLKEGYAAPVTGNVKMILGREPKSLEDYTTNHKTAWQ